MIVQPVTEEIYVKPKLRPWQIRAFIKYYRSQLDLMAPEGRSLVEWKIRQWERCIA